MHHGIGHKVGGTPSPPPGHGIGYPTPTLDMGPGYPGPCTLSPTWDLDTLPTLLLTCGGYHWRPVQTCSLDPTHGVSKEQLPKTMTNPDEGSWTMTENSL